MLSRHYNGHHTVTPLARLSRHGIGHHHIIVQTHYQWYRYGQPALDQGIGHDAHWQRLVSHICLSSLASHARLRHCLSSVELRQLSPAIVTLSTLFQRTRRRRYQRRNCLTITLRRVIVVGGGLRALFTIIMPCHQPVGQIDHCLSVTLSAIRYGVAGD